MFVVGQPLSPLMFSLTLSFLGTKILLIKLTMRNLRQAYMRAPVV